MDWAICILVFLAIVAFIGWGNSRMVLTAQTNLRDHLKGLGWQLESTTDGRALPSPFWWNVSFNRVALRFEASHPNGEHRIGYALCNCQRLAAQDVEIQWQDGMSDAPPIALP